MKKRNENGTEGKIENFNRIGTERFGKKARTDNTIGDKIFTGYNSQSNPCQYGKRMLN